MAINTMSDGPSRAIAALAQYEAAQRMPTMSCQTPCQQPHYTARPTNGARSVATVEQSQLSDLVAYLNQPESKRGTVLYLAYGSNLSIETFRGRRGIRPISQINVQVPSLRVTFDLPGIPYSEPCFANSATRDPNNDRPSKRTGPGAEDEKSALLLDDEEGEDYHKNRWHKGLVGVVYEVTPEDYAHIIQTEGGGASYHDILIDCHPFETRDPSAPILQDPATPAFKAHTLFAPAEPDGESTTKAFKRPDTSYAQPSARYLKLITDGAAELQLPYEYQDYLHQIRPYTITTGKQRVGQFVFLSIWVPFVMLVFAMGRMFADEKGRIPDWLKAITEAIFSGAWASYDGIFKGTFGDGERTLPYGDGDEGNRTVVSQSGRRCGQRQQQDQHHYSDHDGRLSDEKQSVSDFP